MPRRAKAEKGKRRTGRKLSRERDQERRGGGGELSWEGRWWDAEKRKEKEGKRKKEGRKTQTKKGGGGGGWLWWPCMMRKEEGGKVDGRGNGRLDIDDRLLARSLTSSGITRGKRVIREDGGGDWEADKPKVNGGDLARGWGRRAWWRRVRRGCGRRAVGSQWGRRMGKARGWGMRWGRRADGEGAREGTRWDAVGGKGAFGGWKEGTGTGRGFTEERHGREGEAAWSLAGGTRRREIRKIN